MRGWRRLLAAPLLVASLTSCTHASPQRPKPAVAPDVPQHAAPVRSGHLKLTPLSGKCGIFVLSGTHALLDADGQFCRLRVRVQSVDSSSHAFALFNQRLVLADGREVLPSNGGMLVKRQPDEVTLGADDLAEVVEIWDIPETARVTGVRLIGDHDPDAAGAFVTPAVNLHGIVVPLQGFSAPHPSAHP